VDGGVGHRAVVAGRVEERGERVTDARAELHAAAALELKPRLLPCIKQRAIQLHRGITWSQAAVQHYSKDTP
jgi:hypothetical protein